MGNRSGCGEQLVGRSRRPLSPVREAVLSLGVGATLGSGSPDQQDQQTSGCSAIAGHFSCS